MWKLLWQDEDGAVFTTELLMVSSVMVAGLATGLTTVRDALTSEMQDVATSISQLNQSFLVTGVSGHSAGTAGSDYQDQYDAPSSAGVCIQLHGTE